MRLKISIRAWTTNFKVIIKPKDKILTNKSKEVKNKK